MKRKAIHIATKSKKPKLELPELNRFGFVKKENPSLPKRIEALARRIVGKTYHISGVQSRSHLCNIRVLSSDYFVDKKTKNEIDTGYVFENDDLLHYILSFLTGGTNTFQEEFYFTNVKWNLYIAQHTKHLDLIYTHRRNHNYGERGVYNSHTLMSIVPFGFSFDNCLKISVANEIDLIPLMVYKFPNLKEIECQNPKFGRRLRAFEDYERECLPEILTILLHQENETALVHLYSSFQPRGLYKSRGSFLNIFARQLGFPYAGYDSESKTYKLN